MTMKKLLEFIKKLPLYSKLLFGFIVGIFLGIIFHISQNQIEIYFLEGKTSNKITVEFDTITVINKTNQLIKFSKFETNKLIEFINSNINEIRLIQIQHKSSIIAIENLQKIIKSKSILENFRWAGNLFLRLLSLLAIPLILTSIIIGISSLGNIKNLEILGLQTIVFYISTTIIAIIIGVSIANIIKPGNKIDQNTKNFLISEYSSEFADNVKLNLAEYVENIVPKNPFRALATEQMLQIVFVAIFFGVALIYIPQEKSKPIVELMEGINETVIKMVDIVMKIAPLGVMVLISLIIAEFGFGILQTLIFYILTVIIGLLLHFTFVYLSIIKFIAKRSPKEFIKEMKLAFLVAFSTSSSAATLPVTFECVEQNLKIPKKVSGFVLPLGATINMDGTALYQGVAAIFIAQVFGIELTLFQQLTIIITAVLASIGTAPVPGVGILMLIIILNSINVPAEGLALILGVDRIIDMCRTIVNVAGDATITVAIWENLKHKIS